MTTCVPLLSWTQERVWLHFVENARTLSDVRSLQSPIRVSTVADDVIITTAGHWSGIGEALLHPSGKSNIVSMSRLIMDGFSIEADEFMFLVQHSLVKDKCLMFTMESNGLFECAMSHIREFAELMEEAMAADAYHSQIVNAEEEGVIDLTKEDNSNGNQSGSDQLSRHTPSQLDASQSGSDQGSTDDTSSNEGPWKNIYTPINAPRAQNKSDASARASNIKEKDYSNSIEELISPIGRLVTADVHQAGSWKSPEFQNSDNEEEGSQEYSSRNSKSKSVGNTSDHTN